MDKIDLVKMACEEWADDMLTSNEAMLRICIAIGSRKPSKECTEWAESVIQPAVSPDAEKFGDFRSKSDFFDYIKKTDKIL